MNLIEQLQKESKKRLMENVVPQPKQEEDEESQEETDNRPTPQQFVQQKQASEDQEQKQKITVTNKNSSTAPEKPQKQEKQENQEQQTTVQNTAPTQPVQTPQQNQAPETQINIVQVLFESRDLTHYWHLQTTKYSQHVGLGSYYEEILDIADRFIETLQGITNSRVKGNITIQLTDFTLEGCIAHLNDVKTKINTTYKSVEAYTDLTNILDEALGTINHTLYLLSLE